MPTPSTGQMAQAMPNVPPPQGQWSGNVSQGTGQAPQPQGQGSLSGALQGLQLFDAMKSQADPNAMMMSSGVGRAGIPTQGTPPGGVVGALAQIAPLFMGGGV